MVAVIQPNCSYVTCIFRDRDTARSLMGAVQMDGKDLGVHNIGSIPDRDQTHKNRLQNYLSKSLANM